MDTQRPEAAKPRDIIELLREEQSRRQRGAPKPRWLVELLEEASKPFSEEKKARLDEAMRRAHAHKSSASGCRVSPRRRPNPLFVRCGMVQAESVALAQGMVGVGEGSQAVEHINAAVMPVCPGGANAVGANELDVRDRLVLLWA